MIHPPIQGVTLPSDYLASRVSGSPSGTREFYSQPSAPPLEASHHSSFQVPAYELSRLSYDPQRVINGNLDPVATMRISLLCGEDMPAVQRSIDLFVTRSNDALEPLRREQRRRPWLSMALHLVRLIMFIVPPLCIVASIMSSPVDPVVLYDWAAAIHGFIDCRQRPA